MTTTRMMVREGETLVQLVMEDEGEDAFMIELDGVSARKLGDDLFRAGCNVESRVP